MAKSDDLMSCGSQEVVQNKEIHWNKYKYMPEVNKSTKSENLFKINNKDTRTCNCEHVIAGWDVKNTEWNKGELRVLKKWKIVAFTKKN